MLSCNPAIEQRESLEKTVKEITAKCPQMIDSETRLEGISIKEPNSIVYHYTLVHVIKQNVDTHQFYLNLWPGILSLIRLSPEMKDLRENKVSFEYEYRDLSNEFIYNFKVGPQEYNH